MRRALLAIGAVLLAAGGAVWFVFDHRAGERDRGIQLALAGDLANAEPLLAKALARDPNDADILRAYAVGRLAKGQLAEAAEMIDRWRSLRPDDPDSHLARIEQAMRINRPAEAIGPARDVLALRPQSKQLREQLAFWLFLVGRTEEADAECRRCREAGDSPHLKLLHAEVAHRLGETARAVRLTDELLASGHKSPAALALRGALAIDAGNPAAAIPFLKDAIERGGEGQSRARHFLGLALSQLGDEAGARKILAEEQRHQAIGTWEKYGRSDGVGYMVVLAEGQLATGKLDDALRLLEQALAKDPNCRAAHKLMADYLDARGQPSAAAVYRLKATE